MCSFFAAIAAISLSSVDRLLVLLMLPLFVLCYYLLDVYMSTIMMKNDVVEPNEFKNKTKSTCVGLSVHYTIIN